MLEAQHVVVRYVGLGRFRENLRVGFEDTCAKLDVLLKEGFKHLFFCLEIVTEIFTKMVPAEVSLLGRIVLVEG